MKNTSLTTILLGLFIAISAVHASDRIELTDGSVINGKIISADGGKIKVETAFAGIIEIKQALVSKFSTDDAVNVELAAGSTVLGKVETTDSGIKIVAPDGQMTSSTDKVAAVWRPGADSPETKKLKAEIAAKTRKWAYEASVALAGRTGVSEKIDVNVGFKATLASDVDKLIFALATERARDNGVNTANRQFGSADYSAFFNPVDGWYARTSLEKDTIKELDLRSSTSFGYTRKLINTKKDNLEGRLGVTYLYENYTNGTKFDSPGLDVTFLNSFNFTNAKLTTMFNYVPAFKSFSNYRIHHETAFEIPLGTSQWKLKTGVSNDYNSTPPPNTKRLDTIYFTSLLLSL